MARGFLAWVCLVAGVAVCVAFGYGASRVAAYSWDQVVSYASPYAEDPLSVSDTTPPAPLADPVVYVIVDGMRDDVTREHMPNVDRLREHGADVVVKTGEPSLSYPNWTTLLTGAPQTISGVTTNWWEGRVLVPSIFDAASEASRSVAIVGPTDFAELYGVERGSTVSLRDWPEGGYLSSTLVDDALRIAGTAKPDLLVVHLPDLDEAGHDFGGDSPEYIAVAEKIDADIGRLVTGLQDPRAAFVITADHGHIGAGGHGGWESEVTSVPVIGSGSGLRLAEGVTGTQDQVAATVARLAGLRPPDFSAGESLRAVLTTGAGSAFVAEDTQLIALLDREAETISGEPLTPAEQRTVASARAKVEKLRAERLALDREARVETALTLLAAVVLTLAFVAVASWRAFVSALAGTAAYFAVYNVLYFVVHGHHWSLSAFNTEEYVETFFNIRMAEAALAGLVAVGVAAAVYPYLRTSVKGPRTPGYLGGWLALAPAVVLVIQMTLAVQVAWFVWAYGADIIWTLPDFKWAFKYDLDLIQMTALAGAAVLGPLVTYLVGRYHPKVRVSAAKE